ncbi:Holliday junction branch migration DNA helicase RuvB [candidate division KSB1 bacterium]
MTRERLISNKPVMDGEEQFNYALRPKLIKNYVGQRATIEKLNISIEAAKHREEPIEHVLLHGPPGLGKTTLAHIIANEMNAKIITASGPALTRAGDLMGILTSLKAGDVLFIDEIHRLGTAVEEFIYPAMEDFKVDFVVDKGAFAKTVNIPLKKFTLVGATTRAGLLSAPLRNRFGLHYHIDFYPEDDIKEILKRSAEMLKTPIREEALFVIARRSRGTPRIANRLLRRVRDYAQVKGDGSIDQDVARNSIELEGVDELGLDVLDRKYLRVIMENYSGGPVGIDAVSATLNEETNTLEEIVEPFLLKAGFLKRTRQGRVAALYAYKHMHIKPPKGQVSIFESNTNIDID